MIRKALSTREDFEYWLAYMPFALDEFLSSLPEEIRDKLDYSPQSLDTLESWILETYPSTQALMAEEHKHTLDGMARYIGRTFLQKLGGKWTINLDDPNDAYFGLPILVDHKCELSEICPMALATTSAHRRTGSCLRGILAQCQ